MHSSFHPPRAFRNRIARHIGVLVGAVLVTVLGLPSVAQAQKIATVEFMNESGFTVTWTKDTRVAEPTSWIVTFTKPNGNKEVMSVNALTAALDQNDEGTWWIQVAGCYAALDEDVCPADDLDSGGDSVGYTHGPPAAPKNLTPSLVPGGVALTWTPVLDKGYADMPYQVRQDKGEDEGDWESISNNGATVVTVDPGDYTFMVRGVGRSDNSSSTEPDDVVPGAAASVDVTVPMPAPTLPEIALLLLAMLLVGSGAYLLRRRQLGGLTPA